LSAAVSPAVPVWGGRAVTVAQFRTAHFSSRGDSPLIRPPIL
jgi:hypothetical protein